MARVPLIQEQDHPELADAIEKYRAGRRGKLINIYRMLLNSPALAESWFNHSNAVRWKTTLDGRLREIIIIRWAISPVAIRVAPARAVPGAEGLSLEECDAPTGALEASARSAPRRLRRSMTRDITVPDAVFAEVKRHFDAADRN
jgi:hypothetical protein